MPIRVTSGTKGPFIPGFNARTPRPARPFGMKDTPFDQSTGTYLPLIPPLDIKSAVVVSEANDYLVCSLDIDTPIEDLMSGDYSNEVLVAKPYLLRRTIFDPALTDNPKSRIINGVEFTYTFADADPTADPPTPIIRTATNTDDDSTEDQVITPRYCPGDVIDIINRKLGGAVAVSDTAEAVYTEAFSARAWSKKKE